jgi:hypothetical protein
VDLESISIHRGDITGPVIATATSFEGKDGITDIQMTESEATVPMRHKHHSLPLIHGSSYFRVDGRQYRWKNHKELIEEDGKVTLAKFEGVEGDDRLGRVIITEKGQGFSEVAVVTFLIDRTRGEEGKIKV